MKKLIPIIILCLFPFSGWCQTNAEIKIREKIREGLNYVLNENQTNTEDIIIVKANHLKGYYVIAGYDGNSIITKEVIPPDLSNCDDSSITILKDSVSDFIWVKGKTYQTLKMGDSQIPFRKLKKRFSCEKIELLQTDINVLNEQKYMEEITFKYGELVICKTTDLNKAIALITSNQNISMPTLTVNYPIVARENNISGVTRIGFVITKNGSIDDIHVFQRLGGGCTESLISTVNSMSNQLKQKGYNNTKIYYIELTFSFILIG